MSRDIILTRRLSPHELNPRHSLLVPGSAEMSTNTATASALPNVIPNSLLCSASSVSLSIIEESPKSQNTLRSRLIQWTPCSSGMWHFPFDLGAKFESPALQDAFAFRRRHAPSQQFGIGPASHAAERRPRFSADYLATRPHADSCESPLPQARSGRLPFYIPIPGHQFPKAMILYQKIAVGWRLHPRRICRARQFPMFSMMLCAHRPSVNYRQVCA